MSASHVTRPASWTRIRILRLALPGFAVLVLLAVLVTATARAFSGGAEQATAKPPLELASPRLVGEDDKARPFVITARTATRDAASIQKIKLDGPVLVLDEGGPSFTRVTAATGLYDEADGKLALSGGVAITGARGNFATPSTVFDTKAGEVVGTNGIEGSTAFGQIQAGSVAVKDKGGQVVYKGGVRARLNNNE